MKLKKVGLALLVMGTLSIVGCGTNENTSSTSSTKEMKTTISSSKSNESSATTSSESEIDVTIELKKDDQEIAKKIATINESTSLMDALKQEFTVEEEDGFITSIDGIEQNKEESYYWTFTVNGEMGQKGAADTYLKDRDEVIFSYAKYE